MNTHGPDIATVINLNKQQAMLGVFNEEQAFNVEDQNEEPEQSIQIEVPPPTSPKAIIEQETVAEVAVVEETMMENGDNKDEEAGKDKEAGAEDEGAEVNVEGAGGNVEGAEGAETEENVAEGKDEEPGEEVVSKTTVVQAEVEVGNNIVIITCGLILWRVFRKSVTSRAYNVERAYYYYDRAHY